MRAFKDFLNGGMDDLSRKLDDLGVDHHIYHNPSKKRLTVSKIVVRKEDRNKGIGSKAMEHITSFADSKGHRVILTPSSDFGGSKNRLISFYKRHGFVENKGKNKDFSVSETMYRDPK